MTVMLASQVKDAELWLPRFLHQLDELEGEISRVVFLYGASRDATYAQLNHWRHTTKHRVEIYADPYLPENERFVYTLARIKREFQTLLKDGEESHFLKLDCDLVALPTDLIPRLLDDHKDMVAAYVWTEGRDPPVFFDSYVFRTQDCMFHPFRPPGMGGSAPIEVDSVSTCYLATREAELAGVYTNPYPYINFCHSLKTKGYTVWIDPRVHVFHVDLESYGILHKAPNIPLSHVPFIDVTGAKITPQRVMAELFHQRRDHYEQWLWTEKSAEMQAIQAWLDARPLITASLKVLNGADYLEYVLASIYPYVDAIDIVEGAVSKAMHAANPDGSSTDTTVNLIQSFPDPDHKIHLLQGKWQSKEAVQAKLLEYCTSKWMLFIDADEIIDKTGMKLVRTFCEQHQHGDMVYARPERFYHYFHDFHHIIYSLNPLSPFAEYGQPHPFLIWRDVPGLHFPFHTHPMDGFERPIHLDDPYYRKQQMILDGVQVHHFGNARSDENMYNKLLFERKRGIGQYIQGDVEEDMWFSGELEPEFIIEDAPNNLPKILRKHPMRKLKRIKITQSRPNYIFERI